MIESVEKAIIARVQEAVTVDGRSLIRDCDSLPTNLTEQELQRRLRNVPGVYVAFLGGAAIQETEAAIDAEYVLYFLTRNAGSEKQRRTGDATAIGAYELMKLVVPAINGLRIKDVGSLTFKSIANLFAENLDAQGISLYSAAFTIPMVFDTADPPIGEVTPFETFHADWILKPTQSYTGTLPAPAQDVAAQDDVSLPQE
ncbi:MAG TPA: phage protein Gp37 [Stellaceae bacterium]|jgi:phage gp37-like protein